MSSKKKKYNCRFPPARIKKIMQADEEVGKVAAVVPLIISRALELFVGSLLTESSKITKSRNARTLTPSHLKACITSNSQFSFLREFVATIPDIQSTGEDGEHSDGNSSTTGPSYHHHGLTSSVSGPSTASSSVISPSITGVPTRVITRVHRTVSSTLPRQSSNRGRGRPRKVIANIRSRDDDDDDDEEENDINETVKNVNKTNPSREGGDDEDDYETLEDDDDEGSSCDNSSSNTSKAQPNPPLHNQINSFALALNQQVEDDDYDN